MTQPSGSPTHPPSVDQLICDDGEPMESWRHVKQMTVLIESLEYAWRERDDFFVSGNMFLYFSETQTRKNDFRGPDVFVVTNTTRRERKAWVVWEEGGQTPDVVIELLSESTEHVDRGEKMRIYARILHVAEYFLFDPFSGVLEGYELDPLRAEYVPKQSDADGRLRCERLGLALGAIECTISDVRAKWLRWLHADGEVLKLPMEAAQEAEQMVDRAKRETESAKRETESAKREAERAKREAERAHDRARSLEAELDRLKRR